MYRDWTPSAALCGCDLLWRGDRFAVAAFGVEGKGQTPLMALGCVGCALGLMLF